MVGVIWPRLHRYNHAAMPGPHLTPRQALAAWLHDEAVRDADIRAAPDAGLINETWLVGAVDRPGGVLQWVNPVFSEQIHLDIEVVAERLRQQGLTTPELVPQLIPTADGKRWLRDEGSGCWRLWTYVPGITVHRLETAQQAAAAGDLVGRFHAALAGWDYEFRAPRRNIHHTPSRMAELESALAECGDHPLHGEAAELGDSILEAWRAWQEDGSLDLPERPCHGDLKVSNLRFAREEGAEKIRGVCLLDLDTLGPQTMAAEMGDAWRSWCNPSGEDDPDAVRFDFDLFESSARAWSTHLDRLDAAPLTQAEVSSLVPGIERICLELASRFCADALHNSYFRENRELFPDAGRHNLVRATSQRRLASLARAERGRCQDLMEGLFS